jgi:hypothetical protein
MFGYLAGMEEKRRRIGYSWESLRERDNQEDQDVSRCIVLRWILKR